MIEAAHPASVVELWAFDEHRVGLLPLVRKVWAKHGSRPVRLVETRYQWLYLYGFVQPQTGRCHFLSLPRMNATLMCSLSAFLESRSTRIAPRKA
jgi:hypothetical protein